MSLFREIGAVTAMNLRSVPSRWGTSSVIVLGMALVVGVLVSVLGMTRSLTSTIADTGRPDRAIVLRAGATNETSSSVPMDAVATIKNAPGVARTPDGEAAATAEMLTAVNLTRKEDGTMAGITVRGMEPAATTVRPEIKLVEGRMFKPGLREVIVGRGARTEFRGLEIGDRVALRNSQWTVVGVFASDGNANESRLVADEATLLSAYQRTAASSVTVLLGSTAAFEEFKTTLTTNPTLSVSVERENDYYARQSDNANAFFGTVTLIVGLFMAVGALFAALNTMYTAVSTRTVEIATLRAIGFGASGVVVSVLVESLVLALLGAVIGAAGAAAVFGGNMVSLGNGVSSLVFEMRVTPALLAAGVAWACAVGFLGGLFPAIKAARQPVVTALSAV